ncbi:carboxypeptidase-like regulatory domain-containing protein [Gimesia panareensis]|uniref:Uncharacterized protein n=1 Tax=Gimesia panareensis TaxID=2527978 RepID=A0A517Q138_9PLAN|nr:carboxypeptidase-like regulatory domain-containing protein [Gimesia panareensis]QDT25331.1 hypothetical protein Enr10x_06260 [Gimesia panareensis]QDU48287.1 hypothetical protein Pan110_06000 [Gimesia panareensis]
MRSTQMLLSALLFLLLAGCGGGTGDAPETAQVKGIVTMSGNPVPGATVVFIPESGPSAMGMTDATGAYTLKTGKSTGAVTGQHKVTISVSSGVIPMPGTEEAKQAEKTKSVIPPDYGNPQKSGLSANVSAGGENVIDFNLN